MFLPEPEDRPMANGQFRNLLRQLRSSATPKPCGECLSDAQLLDHFLQHRADAAFAALVRRHGPMVLGVCRRLLAKLHDAEDAFQATFLTLVRKGHSIRQRDALGSWLYKVAYRIALRARAAADRRSAVEKHAEPAFTPDATDDYAWRELRPVLDREVSRLPEKYRTPVVLCYLEGKSYEEAAGQLGCPKGTLAIRLLRARHLLRDRLTRRGLTLSAGALLMATTLPASATASVRAALASATVRGAALALAGEGTADVLSAGAVALSREAVQSFWAVKVKAVAAAAVGLALLGAGTLAGRGDRPVAVAVRPALTAAEERPAPVAVKAPDVVNERPPAAPEVASPKPVNQPPVPDCKPCETMAEARSRAYQNLSGGTVVIVRPERSSCGRIKLCLRANLNEVEIAPPADVAKGDGDAVAQSRPVDVPKAAPRCRVEFFEWPPGTINIVVRRTPPPEAAFNPDEADLPAGEEPMPMRG
jgi:RNA polymerase sigma factor (sigma-70 family)